MDGENDRRSQCPDNAKDSCRVQVCEFRGRELVKQSRHKAVTLQGESPYLDGVPTKDLGSMDVINVSEFWKGWPTIDVSCRP